MVSKSSNAPIRVSERELVRRLRDALGAEGATLKANRGMYNIMENGRYSIVSLTGRRTERIHCDIEKLGRELGVLNLNEALKHD
jgi:hypothetical protein